MKGREPLLEQLSTDPLQASPTILILELLAMAIAIPIQAAFSHTPRTPGRMFMAINFNSRKGWFRLWVLAVVIWGGLVVAIIVGRGDFPTRSELADDWNEYIEGFDETKRINNLAWQSRGVEPWSDEKWEIFRAERYADHQNRLSEVPAKQGKYLLLAGLSWLGPSLAVLLLGCMFGWVVRGFRKQPA